MKYWVLQDGADFYMFSDEKCEKFVRSETAPMRVLDFDREAAGKARAWFEAYGYFKGADEIVWG